MYHLDPFFQISTGTGVAPFLQLISKIANMTTETTLEAIPNLPSANLPKLSLIQYLPKNSHNTMAGVPFADAQSQSITDSLPGEEFFDFESTVDAGPDILRHPDVLSPVERKHLVEQGTLRLLRVRAGQAIDQSLIVDSLTSRGAALSTAEPKSEGSVEEGSWFGWMSSTDHRPPSASQSGKSAADVQLQDGRLRDERVGVMACLPVQ
jgi:hypothetical protein